MKLRPAILTLLVSTLSIFAGSCRSATFNTSKSEGSDNNAIVSKTPENLDPLSVRKVSIESDDGTVLIGSFLTSPKPNSPAVLLLHQFSSDRHSFDDLAQRLQARGYCVLAIDGRGFGESTKTRDGNPVTVSRSDDAVNGMMDDVGAAFDFLSKQKNVDPSRIGIVGASYGSSLAIIYASKHPKVGSVVLLSPGLNYFGNMPVEPAVKSYGNRPLLMVAANDDQESADAVTKLKSSAPNDRYEVRIYEKGGHGTGLFGAKVGLEDLLIQFLDKSL